MNEEQLLEALRELPKGVSPPRDLWEGIEPALVPESTARKFWPIALAASLVIAIAAGLVLRGEDPVASAPDGAAAVAAAVEEPEAPSRAGLQFATFLDSEYGGALRELRRAPQRDVPVSADADRDTQREAELRAAFEDIAAAQRRLRERLEEDPDNLQLASLLALTHRQQARSLRALTTTENSS